MLPIIFVYFYCLTCIRQSKIEKKSHLGMYFYSHCIPTPCMYVCICKPVIHYQVKLVKFRKDITLTLVAKTASGFKNSKFLSKRNVVNIIILYYFYSVKNSGKKVINVQK